MNIDYVYKVVEIKRIQALDIEFTSVGMISNALTYKLNKETYPSKKGFPIFTFKSIDDIKKLYGDNFDKCIILECQFKPSDIKIQSIFPDHRDYIYEYYDDISISEKDCLLGKQEIESGTILCDMIKPIKVIPTKAWLIELLIQRKKYDSILNDINTKIKEAMEVEND